MPENQQSNLDWCKHRAAAYLDSGDAAGALASFMSDMRKHDDTKDHPALRLGIMLMIAGHLSGVDECRKFIDGFN